MNKNNRILLEDFLQFLKDKNLFDDGLYLEEEKLIGEFLKQNPMYESLTESQIAQVSSIGRLGKDKVFVVGQMGNGDLLVQVSKDGSIKQVKQSEVKVLGGKTVECNQFKFDKTTQKVLFEQWVRCGIFMGNTPVKTNECYVRYCDWNDAKDDQQITVMVEGSHNYIAKSQIRIFEDLNDFANPDDYIEGVIVDQMGNATQNVLVNALDYTGAVGDSESVRVIVKGMNGQQEIQNYPKELVRTLSV